MAKVTFRKHSITLPKPQVEFLLKRAKKNNHNNLSRSIQEVLNAAMEQAAKTKAAAQ